MRTLIGQAGPLWAAAAFALGYFQARPWWGWYLGLAAGAVLIAVLRGLSDTLFHPQNRDQYRARYAQDPDGFLMLLARSYLVIVPIAVLVTTALYITGWAAKYAVEEFL